MANLEDLDLKKKADEEAMMSSEQPAPGPSAPGSEPNSSQPESFESELGALGLAEKPFSTQPNEPSQQPDLPWANSAYAPDGSLLPRFQSPLDQQAYRDALQEKSMPKDDSNLMYTPPTVADKNYSGPAMDTSNMVADASQDGGFSSQPSTPSVPGKPGAVAPGFTPTSPTPNTRIDLAAAKAKYGFGKDLNDAAMQNAQQGTANKTLAANLGEGFQTIAQAASTNKVGNDLYKGMRDNANSGEKDIAERRAMVKQNLEQDSNILKVVDSEIATQREQDLLSPTSNASKAIRAVISRKHPELAELPGFNQMNARDTKDLLMHYMEVESKQDFAKAKQDEVNTFKNSQKESRILKELSPTNASSRSLLGIAGNSKVAADRALSVLNQKIVTVQDMRSVSADVNRLISQSSTLGGADHQMYNTTFTHIQDLLQGVSGSPTDAVPEDIKQHVRQLIGDMKHISDNVIDQNSRQVKAAHPGEEALVDRINNEIVHSSTGALPEAAASRNNVSSSPNASPAPAMKFKEGDTQQRNGVTYKRRADGFWAPMNVPKS